MLRFHLVHLVLPGLALYRTLQDRGLEQEEALLEVEHVLKSVLRRLLQGVALISGLPGSFSIFRGVTHSVIRLGFPPDGWVFEPVEDNERAIAFDYQRCFYLDVLGSCGAPELTSVFCKADDWLAQALPPQIQWERTQTLAGGGDRCDFRWSLRQ
jgi:hypothetical protein